MSISKKSKETKEIILTLLGLKLPVVLIDIIYEYYRPNPYKIKFKKVLKDVTKRYHIHCTTCDIRYYGSMEQLKRNYIYYKYMMECPHCADCTYSNLMFEDNTKSWDVIRSGIWNDYISKYPIIKLI